MGEDVPIEPSRRPATVRAELERALGHHRSGRIRDARRVYEKILHLYPGHPDALHLLGVAALDEGDFKTAARLISQSLARAPGNAAARSNLGNAYRALARYDEARECYQAAIALRPDFADAHCNLGVLHSDLGRPEDAIEAFQRALSLDPALRQAYLGLSRAYETAGRYQDDHCTLRQALSRFPADAGLQGRLALASARLGAADEARALVRLIRERHPDDIEPLRSCAKALYLIGEHAEAEAVYRRLVGLPGASAEDWNGLGRAERVAGRMDAAEASFRQALALDPAFWDARRNLALMQRTDGAAAELAALRQAAPPRSPWDEVLAGFTIGELLDKQGDYDGAFAEFARSNALLRSLQQARGQRFDLDELRRRTDAILAAPPGPAGGPASPSAAPVFIVGMPRSGTSLVEQILASHASVLGAGERKALRGLQSLWLSGSLTPADLARYLDAWSAERPDALRLLDKMPDNVFLLDVVASAFPRARVIYCDRDPYDLILSCYFQMFPDGASFSTDLVDSAHQYLQVRRLEPHWRAVFGERFTSVRYETLVADLEGEARRLVDFLGLPWEPGCLDFHRTSRPVATASGWQVRQPLYATSVGRSRAYARHLAAVEAVLTAADPALAL